jgi:uncharacterized RDD family membrane protein YckC
VSGLAGAGPRHLDVDPGLTPPGKSASLTRRLGALVYEALLICAMALVAGFAFLPLISPTAGHPALPTIPPLFARTMLFCALAGGGAIYYTWCWTDGRRTLPQKTWRLRIVDATGSAPTRKAALIRYAAGWIGPAAALLAYEALRPTPLARYAAVLCALDYVWALVDPERHFLHDRIAGTRVVQR